MRLAVTGGIAEGKSTVVGMLERLGVATASSDVMAREVFLRPDVQVRLAEAAALPLPVSREDLREAIVRDPTLRRKVNALMHPQIRQAMDSSASRVHEVPLLFEACLYGRYDRIWVVTCGEDEQLRRLTERVGRDQALALIQSQLPTPVKAAFADQVIHTNVPLSRLEAEVQALAAGIPMIFTPK